MGRRKIEMKPLPGELINVTFKNRIKGLANKAQELGILCNTEVALIAVDPNGGRVRGVAINGSVADIFQKYLESVKPKAERLQAGHAPPRDLDASYSTRLIQERLEMNQSDPAIGPMQSGIQPYTQRMRRAEVHDDLQEELQSVMQKMHSTWRGQSQISQQVGGSSEDLVENSPRSGPTQHVEGLLSQKIQPTSDATSTNGDSSTSSSEDHLEFLSSLIEVG